ncbi:50S ribosomal protein L15 [Candidatus Woesearchaeota archaeon]|nr:50S ribosomal protein L15 [Candidatus Woesearchaeota archaeon]
MVAKRRKKFRRMRGSRECGWGVFHRGKGRKGGCGKAGTGKRAKAKMPRQGEWTIQKQGKYGFKFLGHSVEKICINLKTLEDKFDSWVASKKIVKEGDVFVVDLPKIGFNKLLGAGKVTKKLRINVDFASKSAVDKIKSAGGEVVLPQKETKTA